MTEYYRQKRCLNCGADLTVVRFAACCPAPALDNLDADIGWMLAIPDGASPEEIRSRARRILAATRTNTPPGAAG